MKLFGRQDPPFKGKLLNIGRKGWGGRDPISPGGQRISREGEEVLLEETIWENPLGKREDTRRGSVVRVKRFKERKGV